jgi:hypothetical protein
MWWEIKDETLMDMYNTIIYLKWKVMKFQQLMVINGGSCEFMFLCCLVLL